MVSLSGLFRNISLLVPALFCMSFLRVQAQIPAEASPDENSFFLGVHTGGYLTVHSMEAPMEFEVHNPSSAYSYSGNNSMGIEGGISAMYQPAAGLSFRAGISYSHFSAILARENAADDFYTPPYVLDTIMPTRLAYQYDINGTFLTSDILAAYSPFESFPLGAVGGVLVGFPLATDYRYSATILEPLDVMFEQEPNSPYRYENFNRTAVIRESSFSGIQVGLTGGLQYVFELKKRRRSLGVVLVPSLLYNLPLTTVHSSDNTAKWKFSQFRMGVDVLFRL